MQAVHLNGLVNAVNFGQQDDVIQNGSAGATRLKSVFVLTIQPTATYSNPLVFGSIWKKATNVVNENILYWQMFGKLADYSHRPLD
ncbi:MAG TPA: hypothetical protein VHZ50_06755, partial [Puia sp.]|nr:hypothetical protein [Puia sp.]